MTDPSIPLENAARLVSPAEHLREQLRGLRAFFAASIRPICVLDKYGRLEVFGSCTLLRVGTAPILLTAAHVLDELTDDAPLIGAQKPVPLVGEGFRTDAINNGIDRTDLFVVKLAAETEQALAGVEFIDIRAADTRDSNHSTKRQCLVGYPVSRHKPDKAFNRQSRKLRLDPQTFETVLHQRFEHERLGTSAQTHHAIRFDQAGMLNPQGPGLVTGPAPRGMSGGALWYFANPIDVSPLFLSGILIEWHESLQTIIAVKMRYVLSRIAANFPELADLIRESIGE